MIKRAPDQHKVRVQCLRGDLRLTKSIPEADRLPSSLLTHDNPLFEEHLKNRSGKIRTAISEIFSKFPPSTPEVTEIQERMGNLLAQEKAHVVELQRMTDERDSLAERLENASYRYLVAEKKLDRAKSKAVQEMEQQAIMKREDDTGAKDKSVKKESSTEVNGEVNHEASAATDLARREAVAAAEKRKVQIDQLESENKRLSEELSAAKVKTASVGDDDYANTGLFSLVKTQLEGMIRRLNDLEAANVALREEAQKLQAERNSYRTQLDEETRTAADENESQLARNEGDLARIRNARDELQAELSILQGGGEGSQKQSLEMAKELASARDSRISALESELERVRLKQGEDSTTSADSSLDALGADDLRSRLRTLQSQYVMVSNELPSMEAAWKKTQALAAKKVAEISNWEEQIARVNSEKARADQKYFAAMKAKDARDSELRALKAQNAKTSEIVSQLKDTESSTRALVSNLEKQVAEAKDSLTGLSQQNRALQQKVNEGNVASENLKTEIAKLKELVTSRDATTSEASKARRAVEVELEECKAKLEESKKQVGILKKRGSGRDTTDNAEDWRVRSESFV